MFVIANEKPFLTLTILVLYEIGDCCFPSPSDSLGFPSASLFQRAPSTNTKRNDVCDMEDHDWLLDQRSPTLALVATAPADKATAPSASRPRGSIRGPAQCTTRRRGQDAALTHAGGRTHMRAGEGLRHQLAGVKLNIDSA